MPHWVSRCAFHFLAPLLFLTQAATGVAVYHHLYWLAVPLLLITSHLMHGMLIGFHEASHGLLRDNRRLNEIDGVILGTLSFMSFSLYRAAHQTHHMHLATEKDEEFWPFVLTDSPRWLRVLAAFLELTIGILFTPFVFVRTFLRKNSPIRSQKVRRRIWAELALIVVFWIALITTVTLLHIWSYFLWIYGVPAWLAGNLQSWRKYIEHVGMSGWTPNSATRSIINSGPLGKVVSFTLLHEPFHGVHHGHAGLQHAELPLHADELQPKEEGDVPPFASYRHALLHLLKSLADPKVGAQWKRKAGVLPDKG